MKKKLVVLTVIATLVLSFALTACDNKQPAAGGDNQQAGSQATVENPEYTFYLVRHGETLFNTRGVCQGFCDSPLTDDGVAMAKKLGESLKGVDFDACYTSISERAYDTANYIIGDRDIPLTIDERLKETNMGSMEGLVDPVPMVPDRLQRGWVEEGGETIQATGERFGLALEDIVKENPNGGTFLVTSHGGAITAYLQANFEDSPQFQEFMATTHGTMANCAVSIIHYQNGEFSVESVADLSYLQ